MRIIVAISNSLVTRHVLHMQISMLMVVRGHTLPSNLTSEEGLNVYDFVDMLLVTLLLTISLLGLTNFKTEREKSNLPFVVLKLLTFHSKGIK